MKKVLFILMTLSVLLVPVYAANTPKNIAVMNFTNRGTEWNWVSKGLADMLITDLGRSSALKVVERERMQIFIKELKLSGIGAVTEATAKSLGKFAKVENVLFGSYKKNGDQLEIEAHIINVETGELLRVEWVRGTADDIFKLEKELAFKVLSNLGMKISEEEKESINYQPTDSIDAATHLYQGIDLYDQEENMKAFLEFKAAKSEDRSYYSPRYWLGKVYDTLGDNLHALEEYMDIIENDKIFNNANIYNVSKETGRIYERNLEDYRKAIYYLKNAISAFNKIYSKAEIEKLKESLGVNKMGSVAGCTLNKTIQMGGRTVYVSKEPEIMKMQERWLRVGDLYIRIAKMYEKMGEYKEALDNYKSSLPYIVMDSGEYPNVMSNILRVYSYISEYSPDVAIKGILKIDKNNPQYKAVIADRVDIPDTFYMSWGSLSGDIKSGFHYEKATNSRDLTYVFVAPKDCLIESIDLGLKATIIQNKKASIGVGVPCGYAGKYIALCNNTDDYGEKHFKLPVAVKLLKLAITENGGKVDRWNVKFNLVPLPADSGSLSIITYPPNCHVFLDDEPFRYTPCYVTGIPSGKHKIKVELRELTMGQKLLDSKEEEILIEKDKVLAVTYELKKEGVKK